MRCCCSLRSLGRWSEGLDVPAGAVAQVIQQRADGPVRALVAQRRLRRGERLCAVPPSLVLHGEAAAGILRRAAAAGRTAPFAAVQRRVAAAAGDPFLLATRDALLAAVALVALRRGAGGPLGAWANALPPRPPPPVAALRDSAPPGAAPRRAFFEGRAPLLTPRRRDEAQARRRREEVSAAQRYAQLNAQLHSRVIAPLADCLVAKAPPEHAGDEESGEAEEHREALCWAHFMVRSRAVNLDPRRPDAPRVAVVPFVDMLNHSARAANVSYHCGADGSVVVVAARSLAAGEELALSYGDHTQRGVLFAAAGGAAAPRDGDAEMRRVEMRQSREWDSGGPQCGEDPFGAAEGEDEAVWLWRFGFARGEEELAYVASQLWSRGLRERIAHLTDVRRRGRPGEFVVGVPEGLRMLREQRAQLERERYGGVTVFPPQNTSK